MAGLKNAVVSGLVILFGLLGSFEARSDGGKLKHMEEVLAILKYSPTGKGLTQKAIRVWKLKNPSALIESFKWGDVSRTDTVLTRHFDPETGREDREREVKVFLKANQSTLDIVLDLAHELIHATARPSFDPYDPGLTAGKYIFSEIEGEGGEVEAVTTECQVGLELSERMGAVARRCEAYMSAQSNSRGEVVQINREQVRRDFYKVGDWFGKLNQGLGSEAQLFPLLSTDSPLLYSSTGRSPYPVALLKEFEEITEMACNNTKTRLRSVASSETGASKATQLKSVVNGLLKWPSGSKTASSVHSAQQNVQDFIRRRCQLKSFE